MFTSGARRCFFSAAVTTLTHLDLSRNRSRSLQPPPFSVMYLFPIPLQLPKNYLSPSPVPLGLYTTSFPRYLTVFVPLA